ncbi:unnamed protein product [Polarella glacialis]|uniref:AB hydrolase-1 domain-containing protein n=1 Tax=Polarella glacialis TaxID=89957 RepID=A0A813G5V7_POLGL|nr:unnamed protein product [Polarella glacialis]
MQAQTVYGTYGAINYAFVGPETGEVVVCLHGLNGSRLLFQDTANYLSRMGGFRVLTFDLYGHGLSNAPRVDLCPKGCCGPSRSGCSSAAPRGRYDLDFFVDQTDELLSLLGVDGPVNLLGFSLGGTVAVAFAQRFPERVRRLAAISPSGFIPKVPRLYYLLRALSCCLVPLAPHVICTCLYKRERFARSLRTEGQALDEDAVNSLWSRFVWQLFVKRGVASATLAVCSRVNWFNLTDLFKDVGRHSRPVLLIWGERDNLNPASTVAEKVKSCFSNAKLLVVPRAGHIALCDKPAEVIPRIFKFLQLPADVRMDSVELTIPPASTTCSPCSPNSIRPQASSPDANADAIPAEVYGSDRDPPQQPHFTSASACRAEQMPVPMILGHTEDICDPVSATSTASL